MRKGRKLVFDEIGKHMASFYFWSMKWSRKIGTEDLDSV